MHERGSLPLMHPYLLVPMLACVGCAASAGMLLARTAAYGTSRAAAQVLVGGAFWALCEIAWNVSDDPGGIRANGPAETMKR